MKRGWMPVNVACQCSTFLRTVRKRKLAQKRVVLPDHTLCKEQKANI